MPCEYEIPQFLEQVNALLGGDYVTDELISLPIYKPAAIAELEKLLDMDIQNIPPDVPARAAADRAIIYATAIKLVPYAQQQVMKLEQTPAAKTERFAPPDWEEIISLLQSELDKALQELDPDYEPDEGTDFIGFRLSGPGRCCDCRGLGRL